MAEVKIRFRQVVYPSAPGRDYGRYDEYQVVEKRKILSRHDLYSQAVKWCADNGHQVVASPASDTEAGR